MPDGPQIQERIRVNDTPGAPNDASGMSVKLPGIVATIRADPRKEYVSGGVSGSGQYYENLVRTLPWAIDDTTTEFGDDLYARMLFDPQVASTINLLKASIIEDGMTLAPAVSDRDQDGYDLSKAICDAATAMLGNIDPGLDAVLWNMLDAVALGNKVAEQVYRQGDVAGKPGLVLEALRVKPRHMTAFVVDSYLHVLGMVAFIPGVAAPVMQGFLLDPRMTPNLLPREKFLVVSFRARDGDPRGTSVLRSAWTPWNLKQQVLREHVRYLTQFASPSLIGFTAPGALPAIQFDAVGNPLIDPTTGLQVVSASPEQLMNAQLVAFKNGTALTFPSGASVQPLVSSGDGTAFLTALAGYDRSIVKAILSQTLATEEGAHQARAAASVHEDALDTIIRQAKRAVQRAFWWDVLRPWVSYNWGAGAARTLSPVPTLGKAEAPDLPALWAAVAALKSSGYLAPSQMTPLDEMAGLPARTADEVANAPAAANPSPVQPLSRLPVLAGGAHAEDG